MRVCQGQLFATAFYQKKRLQRGGSLGYNFPPSIVRAKQSTRMPPVIQRICEAGVRRRWHRLDHHYCDGGVDTASGRKKQAPNVHNSLAIQKKHVANMYRSWSSLNSHAFGPMDTDPYARHIPVGRVCAERTSCAPLTETDLGNMYAGSYVFAPGPYAYDVSKSAWDSSSSGYQQRQGLGPSTMGCGARKCMTPGKDHPQLPHAKRRDGAGPGPGAYATGDSAVMGHHGGTFAAADNRRAAAAALEMAVGRLKTLEWRIDFIRRGEREPEKLRPGQSLVVRTQSGQELRRMEEKASRLRSEIERLRKLVSSEAFKRDPLPGASIGRGGRVGGNERRPATTAADGSTGRDKRGPTGQGKDRFYDPIPSTATFLESPGPGAYSLTSGEGAFGRAAISRSPAFDLMQRRVVGDQAAAGRSLASLHLHSAENGGGSGSSNSRGGRDGLSAPFHAYLSEAGPGHYTPDMSAPPLPNDARRWRRGGGVGDTT